MTPPRVLLVDDDARCRECVRELLEMTGFTVIEAVDATAALTIIAIAPSSIDLLLTDVNMPGIDGIELARRVRLLRPETRVLYMSGSDPHELATRGFWFQRREVIAKPFGAAVLMERVCDALEAAGRSGSFGWSASVDRGASVDTGGCRPWRSSRLDRSTR
jgi:DNA-binding response OmpR family regulator